MQRHAPILVVDLRLYQVIFDVLLDSIVFPVGRSFKQIFYLLEIFALEDEQPLQLIFRFFGQSALQLVGRLTLLIVVGLLIVANQLSELVLHPRVLFFDRGKALKDNLREFFQKENAG